MITALLLLLQVAAPPVPVPAAAAAPVASTLPPQDWSTLPVLRIRGQATTLANTSAYVHGEVVAGRCTHVVRTAQGWALTVDLAVLITPDGRVRRVTPRAIDCPTVEQYAAGVILGARDSIDVADAATDTWYRTSMTFAWGA
ncbi:MAG: hypothetical protein EOP67_23370 [Sphingomonas sp.]|jgi:hypothetical protein|uniref:hypothetical protein n=1 Tax=Sphingomonas sp. Leaf208 TaxID=1735679 RepID=UPI0006F9468F|nr:hypothetical protein [Sphingomonas sp. Leaf208]KQM51226.1 hypothetical protein ASE69_07905 [Sphingomonas sp. Leaf208]RZM33252.1 MAG: hypothetical protein EOP67_23370 [Sphingomonas sp.]